MESEISSTDSRSTARIDLVLDNLSQIQTGDHILSEPFIIRNLPWRILVVKRYHAENQQYCRSFTLGFFLQCCNEYESSSWCCFASATLYLLSQKDGVDDYKQDISHLFHAEDYFYGDDNFMPWNEIMDPERGFIKNDTIILRTEITVHPPTGFNVISVLELENVPVEDVPIDETSNDEMDFDELTYTSTCGEDETKIQSLQMEVSKLKDDLIVAKSDTKTLSEELVLKSAEIATCRSTITTLESKVDVLESKLEEVDKKLNEFGVKSAEFTSSQSTISTLESKIGFMDEILKVKFGERDQKFDNSGYQADEKKQRLGIDVNISLTGIDSKNEYPKRFSI